MSTNTHATLNLAATLGLGVLISISGCRQASPARSEQPTAAVPAVVDVAIEKRYDIKTLLSNLRLSGSAISPDGLRVLFSSNATGVMNLFEVSVYGGAPTALSSSSTDSLYAIRYFPNDDRILYSADQGGNELNHIYVRAADGSVRDLTPGSKHKASFFGFADDEKSFFVLSNERDPRFFDIYEYKNEGYTRSLFYKNDQGLQPSAISRDKRFVTMSKASTTSDNDEYIYDRNSKKLRNLTAHTSVESNAVQEFTPAGKILMTSSRGSDFSALIELDPQTGARKPVFATDWDVAGAQYSPDDSKLLVYVNVDARTVLHLLDAKTLAPLPLPKVPDGDVNEISFSKDGKRLAFYSAASRIPSSLWSVSEGGAAVELVSALNPAIDSNDLVEGEVVRFNSTDGMEIPGILYMPKTASAGAKVPAMVWVHGGPGGQSRLSYSGLIQYLVNHGYAIYAINNRGSSGYGKTFYGADDRKHGEADLDDVVASKKMLIATGEIAPDRIGVMGGSYGGYMTLAALSLRPDEFKVGVDIFGVANWLRTLESIPVWWEAQRTALYAELGDPVKDKERLMRISPLFHADQINKPLMVLQGANDPRVLQVESDEIVAKVKANGVPVEYIIFPDEGHGFVKRENEIKGYEAVLTFLEKHL